MAENRMMKTSLKLAMRENEILKAENREYKNETARLNAEVQRMKDEIDARDRKYEADMAKMTERYNNASDQYALLEKSSSEKIQEMTGLNRELAQKMKDAIARMNAEMADQKASFEKTRRAFEQESSSQKKRYETRLALLKAAAAEKDTTITTMKTMYNDALLRIENLQKEIDTHKASMDDILRKNRSLSETNRNLLKTLAEKQKEIDGVTGKKLPTALGITPQAP